MTGGHLNLGWNDWGGIARGSHLHDNVPLLQEIPPELSVIAIFGPSAPSLNRSPLLYLFIKAKTVFQKAINVN